jgi:hypothetical protein
MAPAFQAQTFAEPDEGATGATDAGPNHPAPPRTPYEDVIVAIWRDDVLGQPWHGSARRWASTSR